MDGHARSGRYDDLCGTDASGPVSVAPFGIERRQQVSDGHHGKQRLPNHQQSLVPRRRRPQAYVDAINTLNSTVDPAAQTADFTALSNVLVDDPWTISIARWDYIYAFSKSVHGFDFTVDDMSVYENAWKS